MVAGVLGGIAEYFDIDPVLVRVGFVVLLVLTGFFPFGVLYLLLWIVIPYGAASNKSEVKAS